MKVLFFDVLESTNSYCINQLLGENNSVEEFTVVCATAQTRGVGQRGNKWESELGKNLTFSIILKPSFLSLDEQFILNKVLSLAVVDWLNEFSFSEDNRVAIKWPNDIYVGDKKICGILCSAFGSSQQISNMVCGVGINVNQRLFSPEIPNPVSLYQIIGHEVSLKEALESILSHIDNRYRMLRCGDTMQLDRDYLRRLYRLNIKAPYIVNGHALYATIVGVAPTGQLLLSTDEGERVVCGVKEIVYVQ